MPVRSFTPAELSLTERKRLEQPLLVMIWLGVILFALVEARLFYAVAGTLVVGLNLMVVRRGKEVFLKRFFVNIAVLAATAVLLLEIFLKGLPALVALGHYLILIQLCKLFERKRNRDYVQMIALSLTTVVAAGLISQELPFAVLLVVYLVLAARVTMIFTLKRGLDAAAAARLPVEPAPLPPDRVAWNVIRHWPGSALRRRLALVLAVVVATAVGTFFLVPRTGAGPALLLDRFEVEAAGGGIGDRIVLGEAGTVHLSDQVVMTVRFDGDSSPAGPLYLRGEVYERYEDSSWSRGPGTNRAAETSHTDPPDRTDRNAVTKRVSMHPSLLPTAYAAYPAVELATEGGSIRQNTLLSTQISTDEFSSRPVRYTATSWLPPLDHAQRRYLSEVRDIPTERLAGASPYVDVSERAGDLAAQWFRDMLNRQDEDSDRAVARYIEQRLRREYEYTLDLPAARRGRDAVDEFLHHHRRGHCEYFASAMVILCNALDVRARLAVGFLAQERDERTGEYVVRRRDAHAWVEVFTPETDWIIFDPTPGDQADAAAGGWRRRLGELWASMQFAWHDRVIGYDARTQQAIVGRLREGAAEAGRSVRTAVRRLGRSLHRLLAEGYLDRGAAGLLGMLLFTAAVLWVIIVVRFSRRRLWLRRSMDDPRLGAQYRLRCILELIDELEQRGLQQHTDWTLRRRAAEAAERFQLPEDVLMELVSLHYRLRWGGHVPDETEVRSAELSVRDLRRQIAA